MWRINAVAIEYFAAHPAQFDYRTEAGQASFLAICRYFMTHPLIDEGAPDSPDARERIRRRNELDAYVMRSLRETRVPIDKREI